MNALDAASLIRLLAWSVGIQYAFLIVWFAAFVFAHDAPYRLHARWFRISREQFDAIHYAGMAICKVLVLVFFVAPLLALLMLR